MRNKEKDYFLSLTIDKLDIDCRSWIYPALCRGDVEIVSLFIFEIS